MVPHSTKKVIGKTMSLRKRFLFRITMRRFRKKVTGKREGEIVRFGRRTESKGFETRGSPKPAIPFKINAIRQQKKA